MCIRDRARSVGRPTTTSSHRGPGCRSSTTPTPSTWPCTMWPSRRPVTGTARSRLTRSPGASAPRLLRRRVSGMTSTVKATLVTSVTVTHTPSTAIEAPTPVPSVTVGPRSTSRASVPPLSTARTVPTSSTIPVNIRSPLGSVPPPRAHPDPAARRRRWSGERRRPGCARPGPRRWTVRPRAAQAPGRRAPRRPRRPAGTPRPAWDRPRPADGAPDAPREPPGPPRAGASAGAAAHRLHGAGGELLHLRTHQPEEVLVALAERQVRHLLVEGGPTLAAAFLRAGAVDEVHAYLAPALLGAGPSTVGDLGVRTLADAVRLTTVSVEQLGPDVLVVAVPNREEI